MKTIQFIITSITIAAAGIFVSCDFPSSKMERIQISGIEAEREMGISRNEVKAEIKIFRMETANKIMENNRSIADIKRKIEREEILSVRINHEARIAEIQSENREIKRIMDNYSDLSRHNWDEFKKEFTGDMEDLGNSLKNFFEIPDVTK